MMQSKFLGRLAFAGVLAVCTAGVSLGQSTTEGAIAGTVFDPTSAVVPGAAVTIHNDGTNAEQHLTADSKGFFNAPLLEPGNYTVSVTATGFAGYTAKLVVVTVGKLTEVDSHLAAAGATTTVSVSADLPVLNFESPDASATLDRAAIDNVPVQNRRWSALALTTPGVVADSSGFGLVSVRGLSTLLNNVEIDGADDNSAYYSEERGRTREAYSTSENAVREFEVNTGVYSAQFGRAAGGVINSVTRSGTNAVHGELLFNDLDKGFGAYVPGSIAPSGAPLKPKDLRKIYGGSVGGYLIKDRLFWFYTYDQQTHINPAIAKVRAFGLANGQQANTFLEQPDATIPSCTASAATGAVSGAAPAGSIHTTLDPLVCAYSLRTGQTYAAGAIAYNAGVQSLLTDLGNVPRVGYQEINTPKLDYQINDKNRVSFLFHRLRWDAPGDVQTTSSANYSVDAFGTDFVKLDYGLAKLDSTISSKLTNEVLYQYGRELDDEGQQPYSAYTQNNLLSAGTSGSGLTNGAGGTIPYINLNQSNYGFYLGSPYYSYRQALPDERKWQIEDVLYYNLGNHSIRFGGDFVHNNDLIHQEPYYFGYYSYSNIANYLSDLANKGKTVCNSSGSGVASTAGSYGCFSSVSQDFGATQFEIQTTDYAGFVQDNWKVTPRLTLELGVRYDYEQLPTPPASLTSATGTFVPYAGLTNNPQDKNNFGPRIGFSMDVFGTGDTVLRGGYGLYYGRILNGSILNVEFGSGSPNGQFATASNKPTVAGVPSFPAPYVTAAAAKPSSFFLAPNLQNPQVHEFDVALQQNLGRGHVFSMTYLGALSRQLPNFIDVNLALTPIGNSTITVQDSTGQGPLANGSQYSVPTYGTCVAGSANCLYPTGYINSNFSNITELISNVNAYYHSLTFDITNRAFHGLQYDFNYTWSHALDDNQNATATTSSNNWLFPTGSPRQNFGVSQFNVGNRFVGYVLYEAPGLTGSEWKVLLTQGWRINDTFQMQNGLPYSASIGTGYNSYQALNQTWNGVPGQTYIPVIGLNTYQVPRAIVDDLRLQKAFKFLENGSGIFKNALELQLNADMYNLANHENFSTGDITQAAYNFSGANTTAGSLPSANLVYSPQTSPYAGFRSHTTANDSGFLYTPREFQIGARLEF